MKSEQMMTVKHRSYNDDELSAQDERLKTLQQDIPVCVGVGGCVCVCVHVRACVCVCVCVGACSLIHISGGRGCS